MCENGQKKTLKMRVKGQIWIVMFEDEQSIARNGKR
jgi:hypothetical protein